MNTTTVNIKIDEKTKKEAQRIAKELGLSLSAILKGYLHQFVRTKELNLSLEEPSDYFIQALKESDEDIKAGRVVSFDSPQEELDYLDKMIEDEEKKDTN